MTTGASSNIAFARHLSRALKKAGESDPNTSFINNGWTGPSFNFPEPLPAPVPERSRAKSTPPTQPFLLPPKPQAHKLLNDYFCNSGLFLPYLHEPTLRDMYTQIKQAKPSKVRRTSLGLLNMVFALAVVTSSTPSTQDQRVRDSQVFYERALALCSEQMLQNPILETGKHSGGLEAFSIDMTVHSR